MPVGIKDIVDTADLPTENGTRIFAGRRPKDDASVVVQLKAAGAVILGKTVTTELAFFGPGKTRNPHNLEHTPGGSSSGSAAAVADFHVPLALGTQTAGSILRPASYCGCIGWKPTFGLISRTGVLTQSPPLDTVGAFARSVEDVALITDCMAGADARDADMGPRAAGSLLEALRAEPSRPPRLAFVKSPAWPQGEDAMKQAFADFVARLGSERVTEVELPAEFADTSGLQRAVQFRDIARNYGPIADANPGQISAKLADVIAEGRSVTDAEYASALARRDALYAVLAPLFSGFDAIITPASAGPAPRGLEFDRLARLQFPLDLSRRSGDQPAAARSRRAAARRAARRRAAQGCETARDFPISSRGEAGPNGLKFALGENLTLNSACVAFSQLVGKKLGHTE